MRSRNAEGSAAAGSSSPGVSSAGFMTSQFTAPSASLRAWSSGEARMILVTSKPSSPKSEKRSTTTEMRSAAAIVSPSNLPTPTSVSPRISSDAWGRWRSRLMSSFSKSRRACSNSLASCLTIAAILPRSAMGATMATASSTAMTAAATRTNFFIANSGFRQHFRCALQLAKIYVFLFIRQKKLHL